MNTRPWLQALNLDYVTENPWEVVGISALRGNNVEKVVDWLVKKEPSMKEGPKNMRGERLLS